MLSVLYHIYIQQSSTRARDLAVEASILIDTIEHHRPDVIFRFLFVVVAEPILRVVIAFRAVASDSMPTNGVVHGGPPVIGLNTQIQIWTRGPERSLLKEPPVFSQALLLRLQRA